MPQFRVRIEEVAIYDVLVSSRTQADAKQDALEAFVQGYGDFVANVNREVIKVARHVDT